MDDPNQEIIDALIADVKALAASGKLSPQEIEVMAKLNSLTIQWIRNHSA